MIHLESIMQLRFVFNLIIENIATEEETKITYIPYYNLSPKIIRANMSLLIASIVANSAGLVLADSS